MKSRDLRLSPVQLAVLNRKLHNNLLSAEELRVLQGVKTLVAAHVEALAEKTTT